MPQPICIGSAIIGGDSPVWLIAEAGVNHNGDLALAEQLVVAAKRAGADCVKFQTFTAERVASSRAPKATYQLRTTDAGESQLEMLRRLELDRRSLEAVRTLCDRENIAFLSTPYSVEDVDLLEELEAPAYKVASALIVEPELLQRLAATSKPILLSTGLATLAEVAAAVATLRDAGNDQVVVLQCTTDYPARIEEANVRALQTMRRELGVLAGYSDHTTGASAALAAIALGAVVIEKHLSLDPTLPGPDQASSASPAEFAALVAAAREVEAALGNGVKAPSPSERENLVSMRRSLVAAVPIVAGTTLTRELIAVKRPATGLPPAAANAVVGRAAAVDIPADAPLTEEMLA